jgi:hypothetical protein
VDKRAVLRNLEFDYLADYLGYAGQSREYINDCLSAAFRADPNPVRRTFHVFAQVQLEYAAYEDAAAMLHALLTFKRSPDGSIIEALEGYRPGEAVIGKVLAAHEADSPEQLFRALRFADACPVQWSSWFPNHDLTKALHVGCQFFANDCAPSHKELGIAAYNKTKHGPLAVSSGRVLSTMLQPQPSLFFVNKWPDRDGPNPVVVYGFPDDDEKIEDRSRVIHFIQRTLRLFVAATLAMDHPSLIQTRWGATRAMWESPELRDVLDFIQEITEKR